MFERSFLCVCVALRPDCRFASLRGTKQSRHTAYTLTLDCFVVPPRNDAKRVWERSPVGALLRGLHPRMMSVHPFGVLLSSHRSNQVIPAWVCGRLGIYGCVITKKVQPFLCKKNIIFACICEKHYLCKHKYYMNLKSLYYVRNLTQRNLRG